MRSTVLGVFSVKLCYAPECTSVLNVIFNAFPAVLEGGVLVLGYTSANRISKESQELVAGGQKGYPRTHSAPSAWIQGQGRVRCPCFVRLPC